MSKRFDRAKRGAARGALIGLGVGMLADALLLVRLAQHGDSFERTYGMPAGTLAILYPVLGALVGGIGGSANEIVTGRWKHEIVGMIGAAPVVLTGMYFGGVLGRSWALPHWIALVVGTIGGAIGYATVRRNS